MFKLTGNVIGLVSGTVLLLAIILYLYQRSPNVLSTSVTEVIHHTDYKQPQINTERDSSMTPGTTQGESTSENFSNDLNTPYDSPLKLAELTSCTPVAEISPNVARDNDDYIQSINDALNNDSESEVSDSELAIQQVGCGSVIAFYELNSQFYDKGDFAYLIERTTSQQERINIVKKFFYLDNIDSVALSIEILKDVGTLSDEDELYADLIIYAESDYNVDATRNIVYLLPIDDPTFRETHRDALDALFLTLELHPDPEVRAKAVSNQFWLSIYDNDQINAFYFLNQQLSDTSGEVRYALYDDLQRVLNEGETSIPEESLAQLNELLQSEYVTLEKNEVRIISGIIENAKITNRASNHW